MALIGKFGGHGCQLRLVAVGEYQGAAGTDAPRAGQADAAGSDDDGHFAVSVVEGVSS
jgi:hypothetical protein